MKKIMLTMLALLVVFSLVSCGAQESESSVAVPSEDGEKTVVRIAGLTGPTSIGLVKVMEDDEAGSAYNDYQFTVAGSADEITPKLIKGEFDIAAIPSNLASVLFNKTEGKIKLLAVNTLGVLYITEKNTDVKAVSDLKGKTIFATGKGSSPEYTLRYILSQNGIDPDNDITIEWKSEPAEVVALLKTSESGIAMLPQPYVTVASGAVEGLQTVIDLNDEWNKLNSGSSCITGVLAINADFAENNPDAVKGFLTEYQASINYVNSNVDEAAVLVEKFNIVNAAVAKQAIPECNIVFLAGSEMKSAASGYYEFLYGQNPASVGGKLPADDFFYVAE